MIRQKKTTLLKCILGFVILVTISCATYYTTNESFMQAIYNGQFDNAHKILDTSKLAKKKKDALLFYLNRGTTFWMQGDFNNSNIYFQKADYYIEDYQKNYGAKALSFVSNPNIEPYGGEGFEQILLHYYTTLNFAQQSNFDAALVECKRMLIKLQKITDYSKSKNIYKRDAFVHNLMGMIYDAQHDYNNAFIAYRNALEIYEQDYTKYLNTKIPVQLKKDIIRTAHLTGFTEECMFYENKFNIQYEAENDSNGVLLFFWNNGLGPFKTEWSINFYIIPQGNGWIHFVNNELGLNIPFYVGDDKEKNSLASLKFIRVAFPKYVSRTPLFDYATLASDSLNITTPLYLAENIDAIAYRSLSDRMFRELSEALIRLATKQAIEAAAREQNQGLGAAIGIVNALTEKADTRNWQLLPYSINYTRVSLPAGKTNFTLITSGKTKVDTANFEYHIRKNETTIGVFQTIQIK